MINRILAALFCVFILSNPGEAKQSPREFLVKQVGYGSVSKTDREPVFRGEPVSRKNGAEIAKRYLGTNPTKMRRLWCANFLGLIEKKAGRSGTNSNLAKSYSSYGQKVSISSIRAGDIVVTGRKGGGHVGYALGPARGGKVDIVSGNSGGRKGRRVVAIGSYSLKRVIAVRRPV